MQPTESAPLSNDDFLAKRLNPLTKLAAVIEVTDLRRIDRRLLIAVAILFVASAMPFLSLFGLSVGGLNSTLWQHLAKTILWPVLSSTFLLLTGIGILVSMIGVLTAWFVSVCRFPGRDILSVALLLPLALPTYVSAFAYIEFLGFSGPLQTAIRESFGYTSIHDYWFPDYRSIPGAILMMSLVLYPYVYLTSRAAFMMQTATAFDACRTLGVGPFNLFWRVALPMARPAIIVGVALALMEAANDIGAVEFFGVRTLTTMIYDVWLNRSSLVTAAQIACLFLSFIILLLWLERHARRAQRLYQTRGKMRDFRPFELKGWQAALVFVLCALPVVAGFVIPVIVLGEAALVNSSGIGLDILFSAMTNSLFLAGLATIFTVLIGCFFAYLTNALSTPLWDFVIRLATLGYAIPGVILAIGILIPLASFDNAVDKIMQSAFDIKTGLLLSGTTFAIIYAYCIRFLPMAYGSCDTGFQRLSPNFGHAARILGRSETATIKQIYLPLLRPAIITSALLVFVDCMKELPATLLLRPFNFDTLATRVYDAASLEIFEEGAFPALVIIFVGLIPVALLSWQFHRQNGSV